MNKLVLIASILIMGLNVYAGVDKGNGGSGREALLVGQQAQIENVALKIRSFFLKNESILQIKFPEFNIQDLVKKIKYSDLRIVDEKQLIDKYGKSRTCLNFPDTSVIDCKSSGIEELSDQPYALFVLILHEYLGLLGVEETSPIDPTTIAGYSISKRIAPYVTKVNDYDLVVSTGCHEVCTEESSWKTAFDNAIPLKTSSIQGKKMIYYGVTSNAYQYMAVLIDANSPVIMSSAIYVNLLDLSNPSSWKYRTPFSLQVEDELSRRLTPIHLNKMSRDYQFVYNEESATVIYTFRSNGEDIIAKISAYDHKGKLFGTTYGLGKVGIYNKIGGIKVLS